MVWYIYIYNFSIFLISIIKQHTPEYLLVGGLYFLFCLCHTSCGILVIQAGIETRPLRWRRGVLTSGPPGKSLVSSFLRGFPGNNYCFPSHSFPRMLSCLDPVRHQVLSILHWTLQSHSQSMQVCIYHLPQLVTVSAQGARWWGWWGWCTPVTSCWVPRNPRWGENSITPEPGKEAPSPRTPLAELFAEKA